MRHLTVINPGPDTTVQDCGRPGQASLGIGRAGAADQPSLDLGNRLLGNPRQAAGLEATFGGLTLRAHGDLLVALTGAPCSLMLDGQPKSCNTPVFVPDGSTLRTGTPVVGVRSYLCIRGGIDVPPVLGSRSRDTMARLGPEPLRQGDRVPIGEPSGPYPGKGLAGLDLTAVRAPRAGEITLRIIPGPRDDWFVPQAMDQLTTEPYEVTAESNRVGMRLNGPVLRRCRPGEIPSEGTVCGALEVTPTGQPILFLVDRPVTGGYPVIAVVVSADTPLAAQTRPGQRLRFIRMNQRVPRP